MTYLDMVESNDVKIIEKDIIFSKGKVDNNLFLLYPQKLAILNCN